MGNPITLITIRDPWVLYPNPANNILNVKRRFLNEKMEISKINIYNSNGRLNETFDSPFGFENQLIDLSGLASGLYFVEIISNKTKYITKIIVN